MQQNNFQLLGGAPKTLYQEIARGPRWGNSSHTTPHHILPNACYFSPNLGCMDKNLRTAFSVCCFCIFFSDVQLRSVSRLLKKHLTLIRFEQKVEKIIQ